MTRFLLSLMSSAKMPERIHKRTTAFYVLLSLLLINQSTFADDSKLKVPGLRSPKNGGIYVVAHRGVHDNIPENSIPAYQKAIDLGCDFVEIDVRTTKDGHFVSIHNATIDAYVLGKTGNVKDFTVAEIKALDIGIKINPKWKETRVPTFEEVLVLCKGKIGIYLDLKDAPVDQLLMIIKKHKMEKEIIWYASPKQLHELKLQCGDCFPMPEPYFNSMLPQLLKTIQPKIIASNFKRISPKFIKTCHDAGAIVIADESSPDDWKKALDTGLDGIQTDHPEKLIQYLKSREK
jgi:glycerophosphoryl diester phosphodiesterase